MNKTGILLINLGTPKSTCLKDVHRYLIEFLTDDRVINMPWLKRQCLVRTMIVPKRYKQTAAAYKQIWTRDGSPLLVYGQRIREALQQKLENCIVELGMRYQEPSIKHSLKKILDCSPSHLVIFPLFPHYASATTGSVHEKVMKILSKFKTIPKTTFVSQYATHPALIKAFAHLGNQYNLKSYDHILFSFHGLPESHLYNTENNRCLTQNCCQAGENNYCYRAQCFATMEAISKNLKLPQNCYSICFQSRLGKERWLEPYTNETIKRLAKEGKKRLLVFCPSFVCDCLETTYEIGIEYALEFQHAGGEKLDLVRGLNAEPAWIESLKEIILEISDIK